jgi:hypothetical protein
VRERGKALADLGMRLEAALSERDAFAAEACALREKWSRVGRKPVLDAETRAKVR